MAAFDPIEDIENLAAKVILVTGGTTGIGKEAVLALARGGPAHIYFTGRNAQAGSQVAMEVKQLAPRSSITFIPCDLAGTRESIRQSLVDHFNSSRLDIFIANAGIMASPAGTTAQGFEIQFGTNYLGHAVMFQLLRPTMLRTAEQLTDGSHMRFVVLSSFGHTLAPPAGIEFNRLREAGAGTKWLRYGQSKLADIYLAFNVAKRYPQITSISVHPGLVGTELSGRSEQSIMTYLFKALRYTPMYQSAEKGSYNTLWAASVDPAEITNGADYEPVGKTPGEQTSFSGKSKLAGDQDCANKLWEWTQRAGEFAGIVTSSSDDDAAIARKLN